MMTILNNPAARSGRRLRRICRLPVLLSAAVLPALLVSCSTTAHRATPAAGDAGLSSPSLTKAKVHQQGVASIYTDHRTASGEPYRASALCAAHKTLPLGSRVRVTHPGTGKSVIVRINDRGPYVRGRIIDLTPAAASAIGLSRSQGIARVELSLIN